MSGLTDAIMVATPAVPALKRKRPEHPTGMRSEWDGAQGFIETGPLADRPRTWDDVIRQAGFDPDEVEVVEPVRVSSWDAQVGRGRTERMSSFRVQLRRRLAGSRDDLEALIKAAKHHRKTTPAKTDDDEVFAVVMGDLQIGKRENTGIIERFMDATAQAVDSYKRSAKGEAVYLIHLGDCIEGHVSQGGANSWRTPMATTEQVRVYQRLLLEQVRTFAAIAPEVVVVVIPGNHDEALRPIQTFGDSWAVQAASSVHDAIEFAGGYDHVTVVTPGRDELVVTLNVAGTIVAMAHGHQFKNGPTGWKTWWQGQQHGRQPAGDADILLAGHKHHLQLIQESQRTFIQTPALELTSTWFKHRAGEGGRPGFITMKIGGGGWSSLEVHGFGDTGVEELDADAVAA